MVASVIGVPETIKLCRELGGLTLHIPNYEHLASGTRDGRLLLTVLDPRDADRLAEELGNVDIRVPMIKSILLPLLPDMVRMEYNGHNIKALALKYGVSQRTAEGYVSGRPKPQIPGQITLWDS